MIDKSNLIKRVAFALVAVPVAWWIVTSQWSLLPAGIAASIFGNPSLKILPGELLIMVLILMGSFEYNKMLAGSFQKNGFWLVYIWLVYQFTSHFVPDISMSLQYDLYILLIIVACEAGIWGRSSQRWKRASLLFSGTIILWIAGTAILAFYRMPLQKIFHYSWTNVLWSQMGIITVYASMALGDTAAYFAGSLFGKHHFTRISPKKTIEGSIAGLAASIIVCSTGWYFFAAPLYPHWIGPILGLIIGIFGQAGDMLESLIKRYFAAKDASDIIPGHGGVLDRFDSLFFCAPIVDLFLIVLDKIYR